MTVDFNISKLGAIADKPFVEFIELGKPVETMLDISSQKVRSEEGRNAFGNQGNNVIIGIMDSGIDIANEDFKNNAGSTRIRYIWDQKNTSGPNPPNFSYGTEWSYSDINAGICSHKDLVGHGTYVAGIAAGNGRATGNNQPSGVYVGMAPESELIVTALDFSNYANVIDGLLWCGSKAASLQKPWVANLSLGTTWGPRDGTSLFDQAIYGITNQTDLGDGRIIVVSAGNDGYDPSDPSSKKHCSGSGTIAQSKTIVINSNSSYLHNEQVWLEIWYPQNESYTIRVTAPDGTSWGPYGKGTGTGNPGWGYVTDQGFIYIQNHHYDSNWPDPYPTTNDNLIEINLADLLYNQTQYDLANGNWTITVQGINSYGRWDGYITQQQSFNGIYFDDLSYENARLLTEPSTAFNVIATGNYTSKNSWIDINGNNQYMPNFIVDQVAFSSSPGPTRDGRNKPDIYAPGSWVASSLSKDAYTTTGFNFLKTLDGKHIHGMGTSAAAPHVTGTVALLLEQNNDYSFNDISGILNQSKTSLGYLDVYEALNINGIPVGIEDYIWIEKYIEVLNVNQFYYMPAQAHFVDVWPYGDYITEWGNWQITASSNCGDVTVYDMPYGSIVIPALPSGYYWNRDENGNVIATLNISGIDNDGETHWASTLIKIGNVPNTFITSGTLTSNTHWCGEIIITGNITVPSGITLYVLPGAVIKFPNNTSLIVQGKLDARMCTFTSQSGTSQGSWGSISLSGSGAAGSELDAVIISYGTRLEAINTSNILIHGCSFFNTYDAIRFSGSTGSILNNTITTNSIGHGIIVENSSTVTCNQNDVTKTSNPRSGVGILFRSGSNGTVWQNDINGWDWGVGAIWGSSPQFLLQAQTRNNRITNCRIGVEAYQSSWPVIGAPVSGFGFNSIYNNSYKNVYFTSGGTIWASSTYWASPPTATMFYLGAGCSINTQYWLSTDPWLGYRQEDIVEKKGSAIEQENLFFEGIKLRFKKKFREAKDFFISYITNHPEEQAAYVELFNCYNNETGNDLIRFFKSLPPRALKEHKLLLSNLYLNEGMIQEAKNNNNEIIQGNPNTSLETSAKISNIYIALYNDNDFNAACEIFKNVMIYPELSTPLELQLVQSSIESYASQNGLIVPEIFLSKSNNITLPNDYMLFMNYPNPFNPNTLIKYQLPVDGFVTLKIYDILGSEIATLVNEEKSAGKYEVNFNASSLSSGVYIYKIQSGQFSDAKKMILTK